MDRVTQRSTLGSYGYAVKSLAEGLVLAKEAGWITDTEAKREFRSHIRYVQISKDRNQRIRELRDMADELEGAESEDDDS